MKFFNHRAGVVGEKNFTFRHSHHLGDSPLSPGGGGGVEKICVNFEFSRGFLSSIYFFLESEERVAKQLKQVSIVINTGLHFAFFLKVLGLNKFLAPRGVSFLNLKFK